MSKSPRPSIFEHEYEPVPGLPAHLPEGESILWQGAPRWGGIARRALHLPALAFYFAVLGVLRGMSIAAEGAGLADVILGGLLMPLLGAVPIILLAVFAVLSARTSLYTITTRRIVMRVGVALPLNINLPFAVIERAGLRLHSDGTGDITVTPIKGNRIAWLAVWPHTRSFRFFRPEPTLRALPEAEKVAQILSRALAAHAEQPAEPAPADVAGRSSAAPGAPAMA